CAGLDVHSDTRSMVAEGGVEIRTRQVKSPRNLKRASKFINGLIRGEMRALVEPFRHQHFGARAHESLAAFDLDFDPDKKLLSCCQYDSAETKRPGKIHGAFKKINVPHSET